jgi:hypothetical protein
LLTYEFWLSLCKIARNSVILLLPLFDTDYITQWDQCQYEQIDFNNHDTVMCIL